MHTTPFFRISTHAVERFCERFPLHASTAASGRKKTQLAQFAQHSKEITYPRNNSVYMMNLISKYGADIDYAFYQHDDIIFICARLAFDKPTVKIITVVPKKIFDRNVYGNRLNS